MYCVGVLISCAMPAASWPMDSSFCAWRKLHLHHPAFTLRLISFGDVIAKPDHFGQPAGFIKFDEEVPAHRAFHAGFGRQHHFIIAHRPILEVAEQLFDLPVLLRRERTAPTSSCQ